MYLHDKMKWLVMQWKWMCSTCLHLNYGTYLKLKYFHYYLLLGNYLFGFTIANIMLPYWELSHHFNHYLTKTNIIVIDIIIRPNNGVYLHSLAYASGVNMFLIFQFVTLCLEECLTWCELEDLEYNEVYTKIITK